MTTHTQRRDGPANSAESLSTPPPAALHRTTTPSKFPPDVKTQNAESAVVTTNDVNDKCPHCGMTMSKWMPPDDSGWNPVYQYICFNDECPYYVQGWEWMRAHYEQNASYRHRFDPHTGDTGPLAVWSPNAHRGRIID